MSAFRIQPDTAEQGPPPPPTHPPIRKATRDDVPELAAALARAYHRDPVWEFLLPDEAHRERALTRYFTIEIRHVALPRDAVWTPEGAGAVLCLPPGQWRIPPLTILRRGPAYLKALGGDLPRCLRTLMLLERVHPRAAHYYIAYAGIPPEWQGKGVGSALISPLLERSDAEGAPLYLEASNERAAVFYGRHGFAVTEEIRPKGGPPLWLMWRDPRSDSE